MAFVVEYNFSVRWMGDGVGPNRSGAQVLTLGNQGVTYTPADANPPNPLGSGFVGAQVIPGGDSPSSGNMATVATAIGADIQVALQNATILARIQGFSTGGG